MASTVSGVYYFCLSHSLSLMFEISKDLLALLPQKKSCSIWNDTFPKLRRYLQNSEYQNLIATSLRASMKKPFLSGPDPHRHSL